MKKLVLLSTIMASLAGISAFGQGYFQFTTAKSAVYDGFNGGAAAVSTAVDVAFLWAASGDVPTVEGILNGVPIATTTASSTYTTTAAWAAILNDPNFQIGVNSGTGLQAITASPANGALSYNGGGAFAGPLATVPGVAYSLFMIGWDGTYATPALAAAANASVGWSPVFAYTCATSTGIPSNFSAAAKFGVAGIIPEPTTIALAGLGGLALLGFRRRK